MVRTSFAWLADLPWSDRHLGQPRICTTQTRADEDHFDLNRVKDRILEYLAVMKLRTIAMHKLTRTRRIERVPRAASVRGPIL